MKRWRLRAPVWAWLLTIGAMVLFGSLSQWQYQRGLYKQQAQASYSQSDAQQVGPFSAETVAAGKPIFQRVRMQGVYQPQQQMFLDGQGHQGRPGYHVWTPLRLGQGGWVIVNRGWVPGNPDRRILPSVATPEGPQMLEGYWRPLPTAGIASADAAACDSAAAWPRIVVYPSRASLQCLIGHPVMDGALLLVSAEADGLVRDWSPVRDMPAERHFGYAIQWLSLMALAFILFLKLNLKRS